MNEDLERPQPEALLQEINKENRGTLKVFLGAAPGVGKTYAMLRAGHRKRDEGMDVAIGIVETHGRVETEALVRGLEVIPRTTVTYRGRPFVEMDLDAILERKPKICLVDELAHSNIPGSRHLKRYQDVEELLARGIDVFTTLNIQHLESLNDIVERIAGIQVRETLPDRILEIADEIELIDLPPEELIQRLNEGKVYVPEQAARAVHHFFSRGNLTALRELAMRVAVERIDEQLLSYMKAHAVAGPWPTRDRIMVCIDDAPVANKLVRVAKRMADRQKMPWIAVHIQDADEGRLSDEAKDRIDEALRLAERLGGEQAIMPSEGNLAEQLVNFARQRNVTRIVIGRPRPKHLPNFLRSKTTDQVIGQGGKFEVTVISAEDEDETAPAIHTRPEIVDQFDPLEYGQAILAVAGAGLLAKAISMVLPLPNLSLMFLLAVLFVSIRLGVFPALFAAFLSVFSFNFFFVEPIYEVLLPNREQDLLTLMFFCLVAILTGNLSARLRRRIEDQKVSVRRLNNLYDFSRRIAGTAGLEEVLWAVVHHVAATLQCRSLILLPDANSTKGLHISAGYPPEDVLDEASWAAARWAWANVKPAGWSSDTLPTSPWLFLPLKTVRGAVGLLGVSFGDVGQEVDFISSDQRRLLDTVGDQAAVAIERTNMVTDVEEARLVTETQTLRSALLSSLSNDLRTPLVTIIGAAGTLVNYDEAIAPLDRLNLLKALQEQAEILNRYVQNLLDMTRLGYGHLALHKEWIDVRDCLGRSVDRLNKLLSPYIVAIEAEPDLPLLEADPVLLEQVFVNILDNAAKYSPPKGRIRIIAKRFGSLLRIDIIDQGPGIPLEAREKIFDMFYRVKAHEREVAGTGLGLSISRALVVAHGGTIKAGSPDEDDGAAIEISLPLTPEPTTNEPSRAGA